MLSGLLKKAAPTHFAQTYSLGHDEAFHLLEARRGRGKSFSMTFWALQCCKKRIPVVANFHLNKKFLSYELLKAGTFKTLDEADEWLEKNVKFAESWDDIMTSYDCLILVDEVNRLFDAQDRSKEDRAPRVVFEWLQLSRRNRITLVFAAQSMDWLTPRVRQLFDYLWRAKKEVNKRGKILRFWLYGCDPWARGLSADVSRGADFKAVVPFHSSIFRLYDTRERIRALENRSQFQTFWELYQFQLSAGIVPPPPVPPVQALRWSEYEALWESLGARGGVVSSGLRTQSPERERLHAS